MESWEREVKGWRSGSWGSPRDGRLPGTSCERDLGPLSFLSGQRGVAPRLSLGEGSVFSEGICKAGLACPRPWPFNLRLCPRNPDLLVGPRAGSQHLAPPEKAPAPW